MPTRNFPQNVPQAQAACSLLLKQSYTEAENSCSTKLLVAINALMSRQKFVSLLKKVGLIERKRKIDPALLVCAMLLTAACPKISDGTVNGYDVEAIAGHYNELARNRGLEEVADTAVEYHIKKPAFTELMQLCFEHMTKQAIDLHLETEEMLSILEQVSNACGRNIFDIIAYDGSYFRCHSSLNRYFPASRTAHKEGSLAVAQIGLQAGYSLRHSLFASIDITGGNAYEPDYVHFVPNTISLCDAAFTSYAQFEEAELNGAFQVSKGKTNMAAKIVKVTIDGREVKNTQGKKPKDYLRYDVSQRIELVVEAICGTSLITNSEGVVVDKIKRTIKLRAIRIKDPEKGSTWVMTNLPEAISSEAVLTLMRLRWVIERAFLNLKSHNNLRSALTKSRYLAKSMVWASLITALIKSFTIRCAEIIYNRELSTRKCNKQDQYSVELGNWSSKVITLAFNRALPGVSFKGVLQLLGKSKRNGISKPSVKNQKRSTKHHLDELQLALGCMSGNGGLLALPYKPMLKAL